MPDNPSDPLISVPARPADPQAEAVGFPDFSAPSLAQCTKSGLYHLYIKRTGNTFTAYARWERVNGRGIEQATMDYRVYPDFASQLDSAVDTSGSCPVGYYYVPGPLGSSCAICPAGTTSPGGFVGLAGCVALPIPLTVATASGPPLTGGIYTYPAWHMLSTTTLNRKSQTFRFTNTSTSATVNVSGATITGANINSYKITNNGCNNKNLKPGDSCDVTVEFYPPSGAANNRLSNAGQKTAQLVVQNSNGINSSSVNLKGWAVTDRIGPGDTLVSNGVNDDDVRNAVRAYTPSCYYDAFTCNTVLVNWSQGYLALYTNASTNTLVWTSTGYRGPSSIPGAKIIMGGDGNFTQYSADGVLRWATLHSIGQAPTHWPSNGAWIQLFSNGDLWLMKPTWDTGTTGIYRIWP
jgi:hypothetical protein